MGCSDKISVVVKNVIETIIIQKDGWLQYFELVPHENGFVFRLKGYFGGEGEEEPTEFIDWYMGTNGWVEDIADAYVIGEKGSTPEIGLNGNWFIDGEDTGLPSRGIPGFNKIANWIPEIVPQGEQRLHNGIWWEAVVNTTGSQEPGVVGDDIWKKAIDISLLDLYPFGNITGEIISGSFYSSTGAIVPFANTKRTEKIPIEKDEEIWVKTNWSLASLRIAFFNASDVFISARTHTGGVLTKIDLPVGTASIGVSGEGGNALYVGKKLITYEQIEKSVSDSSQLEANGLINTALDTVQTAGKFWTKTGTDGLASSFSRLEKTEIDPSKKYIINVNFITGNTNATVVMFDINGIFLNYFARSFNQEAVYFSDDVKFIGLSQPNVASTPMKIEEMGDALAKISDIPEIQEDSKNGITALGDSGGNKFYDLGINFKVNKDLSAQNNYGILMSGQSNMTDLIPYSELTALGLPTTTTKTNVYNRVPKTFTELSLVPDANWGIWWSILYRLDAYLGKPIYNYRYAVGGSNLYEDWNPISSISNNRAKIFATDIFEIKNVKSDTNWKCMVWIQGESDHLSPYQEQYYQNLKNFIGFVRGCVGNQILPFVIVGMHKNQNMYSQMVRDAQVKVASEDPFAYFINPDSLTWSSIGDNLHYNGVYAEALAPLIFDVIKDF